MFTTTPACPLCEGVGGEVLHQAQAWRLVLADEPDWPGLLRLIWTEHVVELSDLSESQALELLQVLRRVERILRDELSPDKVNVASLGNQVPHLHVHIVPRWRDDLTFPASIWTRPEPAAQTHGQIHGQIHGQTNPQTNPQTNTERRAEAAAARRQSTAERLPALRRALVESLRYSH
jgi:diadenosine tetraphosphate (Ap4A) HIT family hydrolase